MGNVRYNTVADALGGRVGVLVFRRVFGKLIAGNRPNPTAKPPTADQLAQREAFLRGVAWAKDALRNPELRALYTRAGEAKQMTAFAAAMGDFFSIPEVLEIDATGFSGPIGGRFKIRARDDVEVKAVSVIVSKSDGTVLEQGNALLDGSYWYYTTTTAIAPGTFLVVEVTAHDWVGNIGKKNLNWPS